jgi:RNA polymerase sigma factor (sigma-70 family)
VCYVLEEAMKTHDPDMVLDYLQSASSLDQILALHLTPEIEPVKVDWETDVQWVARANRPTLVVKDFLKHWAELRFFQLKHARIVSNPSQGGFDFSIEGRQPPKSDKTIKQPQSKQPVPPAVKPSSSHGRQKIDWAEPKTPKARKRQAKDVAKHFASSLNELIQTLVHEKASEFSSDDRRDIVQDIWLDLLRRALRNFVGTSEFPEYLAQIVSHKVIDKFRKLRRHPTVSLAESQDEEDALSERIADLSLMPERVSAMENMIRMAEEFSRLVNRRISELPATYRKTLRLYLRGKEYKEIANILGIGVSAAKQRGRRGLNMLPPQIRAQIPLRRRPDASSPALRKQSHLIPNATEKSA